MRSFDAAWNDLPCSRRHRYICERDANECATKPCKHGATCKNSIGGYNCICAKGFQGKLCDKVPPNITVNPPWIVDIEAGKNVTLTCNASGDPLPSITWTKIGVAHDQFNFTGHKLHILNVKRTDVGLYRCTANNGFGREATRVSVVNINCSHCILQKVSITITSEVWNDTLLDRESFDYKTLETSVLTAMFKVYSTCSQKRLYRVAVEKFSPGSVVATLVMFFGSSVSEPLKPLQDEIADSKLGQFAVGRQLYIYQPILPPTTPPSTVPQLDSSDTPANANEDVEWKRRSLLLHAIYLSVISLLVALNILLVVRRWRKPVPNVKGLAKVTSFSRREETYRDLESQGTPLAEDITYINTQAGVELHTQLPSSHSEQQLYDACSYTPPNPERSSWEVRRTDVTIVKVIGKGAFCQVAKAEAWNLNGSKGVTTVAAKMLKGKAPDSDRKDLMSELELMKKLKPHPHVIKLMGCVTETDPLLVLIEYIPYGDLLGFLRKSRGLKDNYYKNPDIKPKTTLTSQQLIQFAWQIADGMEFLSSNKVIHRDLAARNVLVGEGEKCKVTDFGMARDVYGDDIYKKKSRGRLPVKWTAYEALLYGTYTTQSDVWSFGVVLYEIFTVGGCPYPGIEGREIANKLKSGYRMPKPKHIDQNLYDLMLQCWQQKPNERPTFSVLKDAMADMLQNNNHTYANMEEYNTQDYGYIDDLLE
ncbi:hypothetical protein ABFA07_010631 [Porites harrisoni]